MGCGTRDKASSFALITAGGQKTIKAGGADCYTLEIADFMEAVTNKRPPRWGARDAVANMAVLDALKLSAAESRAVRVKTFEEIWDEPE